jgi:muramoyltetrapeptide carboxypeptidase LdcA involved in peptidoglycan recycling
MGATGLEPATSGVNRARAGKRRLGAGATGLEPATSARPGDTAAVVSPSFGAVGRWPHRVERATAYLESLGLKVRLMPNAARSERWASAPPEDRVADLHAAFADEVAIVLAGIGANRSRLP